MAKCQQEDDDQPRCVCRVIACLARSYDCLCVPFLICQQTDCRLQEFTFHTLSEILVRSLRRWLVLHVSMAQYVNVACSIRSILPSFETFTRTFYTRESRYEYIVVSIINICIYLSNVAINGRIWKLDP